MDFNSFLLVALLLIFSKTQRTPLHACVETCCLEAVQFLVENGANPNQKDDGIILYVFFGILIINNFNRAPLHLAARLGNASIVEFLLSQKADPDVITVEKDNALHFAAQTGYVDIGQLLIKYTELINAKNSEGALKRI